VLLVLQGSADGAASSSELRGPQHRLFRESLVINIHSELELATCARLRSFEDQTAMASLLGFRLYIIEKGI